MSVTVDPVVARRSLGAALRKLRLEAGVSAEEAADELDCSISKVSRLEKGIGVARALEVKVLLTLYGLDSDTERKRLLALVGEGRSEAWYDDYHDLSAPGSVLHRYIGLESAATELLIFSDGWIPGPLQTEEYVRALLGDLEPDLPAAELDRMVGFRLKRKAAMERGGNPPRLSVLMDESALLRPVGGPGPMRRQLAALRDVVVEGRHDIRVFPLSAGFHPVLAGQFTVLMFASGESADLVVIEGAEGAVFQDKPDSVKYFTELFHSAAALALHGDGLLDRIDRAMENVAQYAGPS